MRRSWCGSVGVGVAAAGLFVAVIAPAAAESPSASQSRMTPTVDSVEFDVRSRIHEQVLIRGQSPSASIGSGASDFLAEANRWSGSRRASSLQSDETMWVFDFEFDPADDSLAYPELRSSAMAVMKTLPDELMFSLLAEPYSSGSVSQQGYVSVDVDVEGDQVSEYFTLAPREYMYLQTVYYTPVYRYTSAGQGSSDTGYRAKWLRQDTGWVASLPWRTMRLKALGYYGEIKDGWGDRDYSPNTWSTYVNLSSAVPKATQSVPRSVPTSAKTRLAKRISLPGMTSANRGLRWVSATPRFCTVSGTTLRLTGRKGSCALTATAPADDWYGSVSKRYSIRLR